MKNKPLRGSLFGLLAKNYLLFTLTLLAIAGGVFILWNTWLGFLYQPADWGAALADPALAEERYEQLRRYTGHTGSAFAVYDEAGQLIYASADGFDAAYTAEELACVPMYGGSSVVDAYELPTDGGQRYLFIRHQYRGDGTTALEAVMILNQDYQVVFGGFGDGKQSYTPREFQLLDGRRFDNSYLSRHIFVNGAGQVRTLLLRDAALDTDTYYERYNASWRIWLLVIPLYLAAAGLFIWWLKNKIGRPLQRLNDAVAAQAEGRMSRVGDCGSTWEIRRIGESFDRFSERLAESEAERRRLDEGRQKLIADISHDLKTPITVISGYIGAICDGKVPPEQTERYLRAIQAKAETLTDLVNAFHEYSKVEHPAFVLYPERTDLAEFLREYLAGKYDEIDLSGFSLSVSIPDQPVFCSVDPLQFRRVLDNLLSNALRHNRLGTVLYFDLETSSGTALLRMGDNGAGIPPDRAARIFEPFVVGSDARSGGGSGLGLAITRRIMEKHGGSITLAARPSPGRSTEFLLRLPLCPRPEGL